jgi:CheY-like chemotaxis protein
MSESSVFVRTSENSYVGDRMRVHLSLPGVFDMEVDAHVVSCRLAGAPGEPGGLVLALALTEDQQTRLRAAMLGDGSSPPVATAQERRILVVEDSGLVREILGHAFKRHFRGRSCRVVVDMVGDADQAWERLQVASYDVVVVDYFLPTTSGSDLISRLRAAERGGRVGIIAISVGGPEARDASLRAGADLFVDKPLVLTEVVTTIDRMINVNRKGAAP